MDLHGIVRGAIGTVNPDVLVTVETSTGSTTLPSGKRVPTYATSTGVVAQIQSLTYTDLQHTDGLNIQGIRYAIYLHGRVDAVQRLNDKGGDLITLGDGTVYKVVLVLERWPDWVKVAVTLQDGP